jgi:hypothetical protein
MLRVVENCVRGGDKGAREFDFFARIEIAIEAWKIAAGNLQAQRVTAKKDVARSPKIEGYFIDLSRIHQDGVLRRSTVTHAKNTFGKILREPVGRDVHEFRREIGIHG